MASNIVLGQVGSEMDRDFVRTGSMLEEGAVDEAEFQNEMKSRFWLFFSFVYTLLCWIDYTLRYTFLSSTEGDPQSLIDIAPLPLATSEPPHWQGSRVQRGLVSLTQFLQGSSLSFKYMLYMSRVGWSWAVHNMAHSMLQGCCWICGFIWIRSRLTVQIRCEVFCSVT